MSEDKMGRDGAWSRRWLLQQTVGGLGAAAVIATHAAPASAVIKISQGAVAYQDHPQGDRRCSKCVQFLSPNSCKLVDGPISPDGFCRLFTPLRQAERSGRMVTPFG